MYLYLQRPFLFQDRHFSSGKYSCYVSLHISFLVFAILSGTPTSQMKSSWIDPLNHLSFLIFLLSLSLYFLMWTISLFLSPNSSIKNHIHHIILIFKSLFIFPVFFIICNILLIILLFSWLVLIFLSLFFTLYVLYFSEKKAYSSEPVYFEEWGTREADCDLCPHIYRFVLGRADRLPALIFSGPRCFV